MVDKDITWNVNLKEICIPETTATTITLQLQIYKYREIDLVKDISVAREWEKGSASAKISSKFLPIIAYYDFDYIWLI